MREQHQLLSAPRIIPTALHHHEKNKKEENELPLLPNENLHCTCGFDIGAFISRLY
jgi:hypothetical protein